MSIDFSSELPRFISNVALAIITAWLTVRFTLRRFYAEKWWERKSSAYSSIMEALHHLRNYADTHLTFSLRDKDLPEEGDKLLTDKLQDAMAELRKQIDIGNFVICDEAVTVMNKLMAELEASTYTQSWQEHLDLKLTAVNKCLLQMRKIARDDLSKR